MHASLFSVNWLQGLDPGLSNLLRGMSILLRINNNFLSGIMTSKFRQGRQEQFSCGGLFMWVQFCHTTLTRLTANAHPCGCYDA